MFVCFSTRLTFEEIAFINFNKIKSQKDIFCCKNFLRKTFTINKTGEKTHTVKFNRNWSNKYHAFLAFI